MIAGDRVGETAYKNLITRAVDYVYIMSPTIIDNDMIRTRQTPQKRSRRQILMPAIPDKPLVGILNALLSSPLKGVFASSATRALSMPNSCERR